MQVWVPISQAARGNRVFSRCPQDERQSIQLGNLRRQGVATEVTTPQVRASRTMNRLSSSMSSASVPLKARIAAMSFFGTPRPRASTNR